MCPVHTDCTLPHLLGCTCLRDRVMPWGLSIPQSRRTLLYMAQSTLLTSDGPPNRIYPLHTALNKHLLPGHWSYHTALRGSWSTSLTTHLSTAQQGISKQWHWCCLRHKRSPQCRAHYKPSSLRQRHYQSIHLGMRYNIQRKIS